LEKEKPDLTVVALGTNILSSPANIAKEKKVIEQMLKEIRSSGSRCVWVGPPDAARKPFASNLTQGVREVR